MYYFLSLYYPSSYKASLSDLVGDEGQVLAHLVDILGEPVEDGLALGLLGEHHRLKFIDGLPDCSYGLLVVLPLVPGLQLVHSLLQTVDRLLEVLLHCLEAVLIHLLPLSLFLLGTRLEVVYLFIYLFEFGVVLLLPQLNALVQCYYFLVELALPAGQLLSGSVFFLISFHLLFLHFFAKVAYLDIHYFYFFV